MTDELISSIINALAGGALIGLAATLMLLFNGRVTGISGILNLAFSKPRLENGWRWAFIGGLVAGGLLMFTVSPGAFNNETGRSPLEIATAGLLVGYGTVLGSGCTSGHGICGVSRLSVRSIIATVTFILAGMAMVAIFKLTLGH